MTSIAYHFWSPTCQPCKQIKPAIESLKEEFNQIKWISVNIQEDPLNLSKKYNVKFVPTIVVETLNEEHNPILVEKQSGTSMMNYYRIIRNSIRQLSL